MLRVDVVGIWLVGSVPRSRHKQIKKHPTLEPPSQQSKTATMTSTSPRRSLKTEDDKGIICSSYTDIHPIQFSYTIDTTQSDDESIRSAIGDLESHSLNWLAGSMLPCGARRLDWDPLDSLHGSPEPDAGTVIRPAFIEEKDRTLRPDVFRELGIVGLKSSPDDFVASSKWPNPK